MNNLVFAACVLCLTVAHDVRAQRRLFEVPEVRQFVTFRWADRTPFGHRPTMDTLVDLYRQAPAVLRMRGFRESESPEPFDLVLMTSYRGLEGFEIARKQIAGQRTREGRTIFSAYETLDRASQWHRDEFIEMLGDLEHRGSTEPRVFILEWVRLVPASFRAYELLLQSSVVPWERDLTSLLLTETGRVLVGDGWDYVRILGFPSLSEYHDYVNAWRDRAEADQLALHIANRKVVVVREDETLRVR